MGVVVSGVVALWTVVAAFLIVAEVVCLVLLVVGVGGGAELCLLRFAVGIGGLTTIYGFLLGVLVPAAGFLLVVGAAVPVGFLLITNSAMWKCHKGHVSLF